MPTITPTLIKGLAPVAAGKEKARIFDDRTKGFLLEQRASGVLTFYFRYLDARRRTREVKLGRLGDVTVAQARKRAEELKAQVSLGRDPLAEVEAIRAIPRVAAFIRGQYLPDVKASLQSYVNYKTICEKRLIPEFGDRCLDEVTAAQVAIFKAALLEEGLSNATTNRHLAVLRSIFNKARKWRVFLGDNPATAPGMLPEQHRENFLSADQMRALSAAVTADPDQVAASVILLLVLTGARRGEALQARWEHIDLGAGRWVVPRSKSGQRRVITLSDLAGRLLPACPALTATLTSSPAAARRASRWRASEVPGTESASGPAWVRGCGCTICVTPSPLPASTVGRRSTPCPACSVMPTSV